MIPVPRPLKLGLMLAVFGTIFCITHFYYELRPSDVRDIVLSFGWWGPVVFFLIYAIGPVIFLPTSILSLGAGLAFGVWPGVLYILFGATAAAVTGYVMARLFGRSVLKVDSYPWSKKLFTQMKQRGFLYVFVLRLIPLVSFDLLSYAGGIAKVKFKSFLLATVLGMIPGTLAYSFLGASIASGSVTLIFIAALVFVSLLGVTYYFREPVKKWLGLV